MLDDRLYIRIMNIIFICQCVTILLTLYFFIQRRDTAMSKSLHRILLTHIVLCSISGFWLHLISKPIPLVPCVAFYSVGPLTQLLRIPFLEVYAIQLLFILGQATSLTGLLTWRCLAVMVHLSPKMNYILKQIYIYHTVMSTSALIGFYVVFKIFPINIDDCLKNANIVLPDELQMDLFMLDAQDIKTILFFSALVEFIIFYAIFGVSSSVILVYKLHQKRESNQSINSSSQRAVSITVLALASVEIVLVIIPMILFLLEYILKTYNASVIKISVTIVAFSHIVTPLSLLFTLRTFRKAIKQIFHLEKVSTSRLSNTLDARLQNASVMFKWNLKRTEAGP